MSRANFSIATAGIVDVTVPLNGTTLHKLATAQKASETTSGTTRRKPKGWKTPTPYQYKHVSVTYHQGSCFHQPQYPSLSTGQRYVGIVGDPGVGRFNGDTHFDRTIVESNAISDPDGLRNRALISARGNLKGGSVNYAVAFAERNQTAKLVGDTAIRLVKSLRQLRRGHVRDAMRTLGIASKRQEPRGNSVPQKWLELQYGWKPLLSDVYGACDDLSKRRKDDWSVTAKGRAKSVANLVYSKPLRSSEHYFDGCNVVTEVKRSVFARIDAQPTNEVLISLSSVGITNPGLIAWELVPFSFVVDWFLPIGDWLNSLDATLGFQIVGYSNSYLVKAKWDDVFDGSTSVGIERLECHYRGSKRLVYLDRQVSTSLPLPAFPSLKDPRSLGHMANALALLAQVFRRK